MKKSKDMHLDGVLVNNECFTHPLIVMDLNKQHPCANADDSMGIAWEESTVLALDVQKQAQESADCCVSATTKNFDSECSKMPEIF